MTSGVYQIRVHEFRYIGSSINIEARFRYHRKWLRRHNHDNSRLQELWDQFENDFQFQILEFCEPSRLQNREQVWIDLTPVDQLINLTLIAGKTGRFPSDETRQKMSEATQNRVRRIEVESNGITLIRPPRIDKR